MLPNFKYVHAASVAEAVKELASADARLHAGGTDLLPALRDGVFAAKKVVSISGLGELRRIRPLDDGGIAIGALATLAEIAEHRVIRQRYTALAQAAKSAATPQIRNQGTLGGNLCQRPRCWYFRSGFDCLRKGGDTCYAVEGENEFHCIFGGSGCYMAHPSDAAPALSALQARVQITGPKGTRIMPLDEFFVPPSKDAKRETVLERGEILTEILLPAPAPNLRSSYRKTRVREAWDFALAGVALALQMTGGRVEHARIFLSGVAPVPWRVAAAEKALVGRKMDVVLAAEAASAATHGAEPLSQNAYKVDLVRGVVEEALAALA
jgi:xanthine dehydrogenase YagS FAD-binding subunit